MSGLEDEFLAEQRFSARLSPVTLRGYRESFRLLRALLPNLTLQQLSPSAMTEFFRRLQTRRRERQLAGTKIGVKTSTVLAYRSKLNRFFAWLRGKGLIQANPFEGMPYPRVVYENRKYLGRSAVERIFAALVLTGEWRTRFLRKRNIAIFSVLLYTGIRKGNCSPSE